MPAAPDERPPGRADTAFAWGFNMLRGGLALSLAYRAVRNPRDFIDAPTRAIAGAMTFSERLGEADLQSARHAVLERYGAFIPPHSTGRTVEPQFSFQIGNYPGVYHPNPRGQGPVLAVAPYQRAGSGAHAVAHEMVHACTDPELVDTLSGSAAGIQLMEALTEHLADKLPGSALGKLSPYDFRSMSNGKNMQKAAAELEQAIGEETLHKAMFSGDPRAVAELSKAAVDIFPKEVTAGAWNAISKAGKEAGKKAGAHEMAEAYLAASLIYTKQLPSDSDWRISPRAHLSLYRFSAISPAQQKALVAQAEQARQRLGPAFDQAFCNFDENAATEALRALRDDLMANWKRVL